MLSVAVLSPMQLAAGKCHSHSGKNRSTAFLLGGEMSAP